MPLILIKTLVNAERHLVFDLARSIDLHTISTQQTHEVAITGVTSGLIGLGETVTWRAKHLGIYQNLTSKITQYERPNFFVDEMQKGAFKSIKHKHSFEDHQGNTLMIDSFDYKSPLGFIGRIVDQLFLESYMRNFLLKRNQSIKEIAESDQWRTLLNAENY